MQTARSATVRRLARVIHEAHSGWGLAPCPSKTHMRVIVFVAESLPKGKQTQPRSWLILAEVSPWRMPGSTPWQE